jgi:Helix-turn-helix domain/Family of unknown function (DUF6247)
VVRTTAKGTRVTGAERDRLAADLKRRYESGESIRALAAATDRSYGFIHRILTESGVNLRGRGGEYRGRQRRRKDKQATQTAPKTAPPDPQAILAALPERERPEFLRQYHAALDTAVDPAGYEELQQTLKSWSLAVVAANRPGYYEAIEEAKNGVGEFFSFDDALAAELARRG